MKFSLKIIYLYFCLLITSCQSTVQYPQLANQEMLSFAREVKATDNLTLVSSGGGFFERINNLSLTFSSTQTPTIDQARVLFSDIANRFLERINQSQAIRCYLVNHPFTIDNINLHIIFPDAIGYVNGVTIGPIYIHKKRNFITYFGYDPSTQESEIIFQEPISILEKEKIYNTP